nr:MULTISPECIES: transglutaminase N-terminal domain-containing protein [Rhizobium]
MLNIHHRTTYAFREKVSLSPHRLMLRPREGRCWFSRGTEPVFPPRSEPPLSMVF